MTTSNAGLWLSLGWVKRLDQCEKFDDRTRPAMNQHQRYCVEAWRALMDKINLLSINFRGELVKAVDLRFLCTPVVIVLPIIRQFSDLLDVGAVLPTRARKLIGPFGLRQTVPEIDKNLVGNMHFERLDCGGIRLCQHSRLSKRS